MVLGIIGCHILSEGIRECWMMEELILKYRLKKIFDCLDERNVL